MLDDKALDWYKAAGDAPLNENQLAWRVRAALRAGDWHEVWVGINTMTATQQREAAWRYWKARALKALGRPALAEPLLTEQSREYNFYGQLAAEELGASPVAMLSAIPAPPDKSELEKLERMPAVQRTIALYQMDMRVEAAREWSWFASKLDDKKLLIAAEVANRNQMIDRSIHAADRTTEIHDFTLRYPSPYRDSLREHVDAFGLDEAWVYGLMRQESRFVTQAKSNVGAAGLMQVMPSTARWIAKKLHLVDYRKDLIHQLDMNLKLGTYYMKNVLSTLDESPVLASAAYNAGPGRARRWRGNRPLEGAIYAETIPFDETRDYVKKVMSNTAYYAKIFGHPTQPLKQRLGIIAAKSAENVRPISDER
jgi:soluble lytic murein transglycosylase